MTHCQICRSSSDFHQQACVHSGSSLAPALDPDQQGANAAPKVPKQSTSGWRESGGSVSHLTLRFAVQCDHCVASIPLNGPTQVAHCDECLKDTPLTQVPAELARAAEGMQRVGSLYRANLYSDPNPQCASCDASVPIDQCLSLVGATTTIPCHCGAGCPTYPAPGWLKAQLPGALQIFGGDAQTAKEEGSLVIEAPARKARGVAMACPACRGGLTITAESERTTTCHYCQASVFLPDELWRRMHPARSMQRWTLTYTGELKTSEDLADEKLAEEQRSRSSISVLFARESQARESRERKSRERESRERESRERKSRGGKSRRGKSRRGKAIIVIAVALIGLLGFAIALLLYHRP